MGIMPLQFLEGENADKHGLKGTEQFTIDLCGQELGVGIEVEIKVSTGTSFKAKVRLDTDPEVSYYKNGGILPYVLRKLLN